MAAIWAGIDAGKTHHHCVAIDESGRRLLSRRVSNDEPELLDLLASVMALGEEVSVDAGRVTLCSRRGTETAPAFPEVVAGAVQLPDTTALDGVM